mmetsp:Transcript_61467/g.99414  ORF Transcript_61467/g.99414 Transcript_61467/m.99414 type:complete len:120 (+) Transcript_61467:105-464(+)
MRQLSAVDIVAGNARSCNDSQAAMSGYMELLKYARQLGDQKYMARACFNMTSLLIELRDTSGALQMHAAHLEIAEEMNDDAQLFLAHGSAVAVFLITGDWEKAIYHQNRQIPHACAVCV